MRLTISRKLAIGIAVMLSMVAILAGIILTEHKNTEAQLVRIRASEIPLAKAADEMEINLLGTGFAVLGYLHDGDSVHLERIRKDLNDFARFFQSYVEIEGTSVGAGTRDEVKKQYDKFVKLAQTLIGEHDQRREQFALWTAGNARLDRELEGRFLQTASTPSTFPAAKHWIEMAEKQHELSEHLVSYLMSKDKRYLDPVKAIRDMRVQAYKAALAVDPKTRTSPQDLAVEFDHHDAMGDALLALDAQIAQLALRGLSLSIDDFGTGYSSLSYLQRLPVHKLKIDQSFVADIKEGHESSPVTEAIIALAAKLHLKVVAEGVETAQQWTYLRAVGCDEAQGFFVARPMPIEAVQDWYQRRTRKLIQVAG